MAQTQTDNDRLILARELVNQIEHNNEGHVNKILCELTQIRNNDLFREVGKLTRDLHDTLNNFGFDDRLSKLATNDIPDAKQRLNHVIDMTEQSALRTLNAVEQSLPLSQTLSERSRHFKQAWDSFRRREMTVEEFRQLNRDIDDFFESTDADLAKIHENLSDIMLAQETQDLSGQIIRQVILLVQNMEDNLVKAIRITGQGLAHTAERHVAHDDKDCTGPVVPGVDNGDVVHNQDEVDELLTSLGF